MTIEDQIRPLSAVDIAYEFVHEAGMDWTRKELVTALDRAGFSVDGGAELDGILEAVRERLQNENILAEATDSFLRQNGFRNLREAAEMMDCSIEEVVEYIAAKANLFGRPH